MVAVVDNVVKDIDLQKRLTSSVNQLVSSLNICQTKTMQSQNLFDNL